MGAGATQAGPRVSAPAHHRYIEDALLIVLNPRRIPDCLAAFKAAPIDTVYVQGLREADAILATNRLIEQGGYARYLIVSDDVIITPEALHAVVAASKLNDHRVVTGYCNLDAASPLVNLTRRPLAGDTPTPAAYDFYRRDKLPSHGTIRSGLAGFALTCIPGPVAAKVLPLGWYGNGWASDFHLSKRLEQAGIEIVAPVGGFVWHVKENWNEPDAAPDKRLHIGKGRIVHQRRPGRMIGVIAAFDDQGLVGRAVKSLRKAGCDEVVVFDGAWRVAGGKRTFADSTGPSRDGTVREARAAGARVVTRKRPWASQEEKRTRMFHECGARRGDSILILDTDETLHGEVPDWSGDGVVLLRNIGANDLPDVRGVFPNGDFSPDWRPAFRVFDYTPDLECRWPGGYFRGDRMIEPFAPDGRALLPLVEGLRVEHRLMDRSPARIAAKASYYRLEHPFRSARRAALGSTREARMSEKIAEKDITKVNDLGQNVVLVPAGQPIPEDLDLSGSSADSPKAQKPAEDKARKAPASAKRKK